MRPEDEDEHAEDDGVAIVRADVAHDESLDEADQNSAERRAITSAEIEKWPTKEILKRMDEHGVPSAPVLSRTELLEDEQVRVNELIEIHDDARFGPVRQPRPAARFDRTPAAIVSMAPFLGEQNVQIMGELGYPAAEIERLAAAGILAGAKAR